MTDIGVADRMINTVLYGDCRESMKAMIAAGVKVQMCVTSPPYWGLRSYVGDSDPNKVYELGLEPTPEAYVNNMVDVFDYVKALLHENGLIFVNLGDSYSGSGVNYGTNNPGISKAAERGDVKKRPPAGGKSTGTGGFRDSARVFGLKPKDLVGIPWMVAFALRAAGWYLRADIIWHKPNPMPESVRDRQTRAHEYLFLLSKNRKYFYDADAIKEAPQRKSAVNWKDTDLTKYSCDPRLEKQGTYKDWRKYCPTGNVESRNLRSVWTIATAPYPESHFATFPPDLIKPCILAGSRPGDIVFDPFMGSGTTAQTAEVLGRNWLGCELNTEYKRLIDKRTAQPSLFSERVNA